MRTVFLQLLSDLLSALVFLAVLGLTGSIAIGAVVAIAVALGQLAIALARKQKISAMQWMGLAVAVVLSSLSLITRDSRFIQLKPSIAHFAIGAVMLKRGWQLPYMPPKAKAVLPERTFIVWGYAWAALMMAMGLANIAAAQWLSLAGWGAFVTSLLFGKLLFFLVEYATLRSASRRAHSRRSMQQAVAPEGDC